MKLIKSVIISLLNFKNIFFWKIQYYLNILGKSKNVNKKMMFDKKFIFIIPHADDEILSSYNFLKNNKNNCILFYCGFTGSNISMDNKAIRKKEFLNFCKKEKISYRIVEDFEIDLLDTINKFNPKAIFMPSYVDWHLEHRLVNNLVLDIFNNHNFKFKIIIIWYRITVPMVSNLAMIYPMTKVQQNMKYEVFSDIYFSQKHMPLKRFKYYEKLSGKNNECFSGENFMMFNYDEWEKILLLIENEKINIDYNKLKFDINNISANIQNSKKYYNQIEKSMRDE